MVAATRQDLVATVHQTTPHRDTAMTTPRATMEVKTTVPSLRRPRTSCPASAAISQTTLSRAPTTERAAVATTRMVPTTMMIRMVPATRRLADSWIWSRTRLASTRTRAMIATDRRTTMEVRVATPVIRTAVPTATTTTTRSIDWSGIGSGSYKIECV